MSNQAFGQPGPTLVQLGNVTANEAWVVTPVGTWPIADVNVTTVDQTNTTSRTPAWAIVLVVVFIWFFLLSLLFLLAREVRVGGYIAIHISARNGQTYTEQVPVYSEQQRADVFARAGYPAGPHRTRARRTRLARAPADEAGGPAYSLRHDRQQ